MFFFFGRLSFLLLKLKNRNRYLFHIIIFVALQEWPNGSLEEIVQNAMKTWDMELSHKTRLQDIKTINPEKFKLIVNGEQTPLESFLLFSSTKWVVV